MSLFQHYHLGEIWDFGLLALLVIGQLFLLWRTILCRVSTRPFRWWTVGIGMTFLVGSWFLIEQSGKNERDRDRVWMEGEALDFSHELEQAGHAELSSSPKTDGAKYQGLLETAKHWLKTNPRLIEVYTFRLRPEGTALVLLEAGSTGAKSVRAAGSVVTPDPDLIAMAKNGGSALSNQKTAADGRLFVTTYCPLTDRTGKMDAFAGIEFDVSESAAAVRRARFTITSYLAAFVLALTASVAGISAWSLGRENQQHELAAAATETAKRKLEDIINSVDGVVWEWDVAEEKYIFVSSHASRLLGQPEEVWLSDPLFWKNRIRSEDVERVLGQRRATATRDEAYQCEYRLIGDESRLIWVRERASRVCEKGRPVLLRGVMSDVTLEKIADCDLEDLNKELVETSRRAGMAEVASGVLHNVGNVLNSVNVSCTVVSDLLNQSKLPTLDRVVSFIDEQAADLPGFFAKDPRAAALLPFLKELTRELSIEHEGARKEMRALIKSVAHIKHVVTMQQSYASIGGVVEPLSPEDIIEDALRLHETACTRDGIEVVKHFDQVPAVQADRNRVLQILVNLMGNAKHALSLANRPDKRLTLSLLAKDGNRVRISVADNGIGIPPENLARMFTYGFTTKRDGHGFGLHSGAIAAREMGGSLTVESAGSGLGAVFILELPFVSKSATYTPRLS